MQRNPCATRRGRFGFALVVLVCATGWLSYPAAALEPGEDHDAPASEKPADEKPDSETPDGPPEVSITRADLAASYLRLEEAFFARRPPAEETAKINVAFDDATRSFFLGNNARAIAQIDRLADSLAAEELSPAERALSTLKVGIEPPCWPAGQPVEAVCRLVSIYALPSEDPVQADLRLTVESPTGETIASVPLQLTFGAEHLVDLSVPLAVPGGRLSPGLHRVTLTSGKDRSLPVGRVHVIAGEPIDEQRKAHEQRLAKLEPSTPAAAQAIAICRARNRLLDSRPSEDNSAQFLSDLNALAADVAAEVRALEAGKQPYLSRQGDTWRALPVGKREIPLRLYVPKLTEQKAAPLLVVLHGMGGDENMFFEAYGAGVVKRIADEKVLIVASPLTYSFGGSVKSLEALVDALQHDYSIDRDRVYVLGHSMGAGTAASLARGNADTVAAACCIAGGRFQAAPDSAPILVVSPALDGIVPPKRVQDACQQAISAGMPGELKIMPDYGHTLSVGAVLPEAIDWLLGH